MANHNPESSKDYMTKKPAVKIQIYAAPKGDWKALGGSDRDQWNERLSDLVTNALPVNQQNAKEVSDAGSAVAGRDGHEARRPD